MAKKICCEFAAPEVLFCDELTDKSDVFSFTLILFWIVVGYPPFKECSCLKRRDDGQVIIADPIAIPDFIPDFIYQLITLGLSADPKKRPTFKSIIDTLKGNNFKINNEVDSAEISAIVREVELSER
jgi:serine/threonine protein kinase